MTVFIGIAGTHSTGKTTFVDEVLKQARELGIAVEVVGDVATRCRDAGFAILRDHSFESTLWIMTSVIKAELEAGLKAHLVLVDRPVPDALGYLEAALSATGRTVSDDERAYLYTLAKQHAGRYSLFLKTQLDGAIPLGEGRDSDLQFRRDADRCIGEALRKLGVEAFDPNSEAAKERVRSILRSLSQPK